MKNEEFRKMFSDYAKEISDPENRKVCLGWEMLRNIFYFSQVHILVWRPNQLILYQYAL